MRHVYIAVALCTMVLAQVAVCQQDDPIQQWTFEEDVEGWVTLDPLGVIARTTDAAHEGEGALEFAFPQRGPAELTDDADIPGVILTGVTADASALKSMSLAVHPSASIPLIVSLNEEDRSSYMTSVWCEGGTWTEIELALSDFHLSNDSVDENEMLDPDQISAIGFVDASLLARMLVDKGLPFTVPPAGDMTILLDDLTLSSAEPSVDLTAAEDTVVIDKCDRPTIQWLPLGGSDVALTTEEAADEGGDYLSVVYTALPGTIFGMLRGIEVGSMEGCTDLSLEMRSYFDGEVVILLEQPGEVRFSTTVRVGPGDSWQQLEIPLIDFQPDKDSGAEGMVDPGSVRQITFADIRAMLDQTLSTNTWEIRNIVGAKP